MTPRHFRTRSTKARVVSQHADWLTLVEPSGQFLTLPVLRQAFPTGLPKIEGDLAREVRERAQAMTFDDTAAATQWIEYLLEEVLAWGERLLTGIHIPDGLQHAIPERRATLRPDYVLMAKGQAPRVLVQRYATSTRLDARLPGEGWAATPIDRAATMCRALGVRVALVTNGRHFALVYAPSDKVGGHATWDTSLFAEGAEVSLLNAFVTVLGAAAFYARGAELQLEALLEKSASAQAELTTTLGLQVRRSVELLVGAISRANLEHDGQLLKGIAAHHVYEAASTVVMRLVFMLYAEERGLLRLGEPLYDENYAASTLLERLEDESDLAGDEPLELRSAAWQRLLASFRALYGGVTHDRLRMPAFGGSLFDPDRFPFLEGRTSEESWREAPARPVRVDDLTIRELLRSLQVIETREAGSVEARKLSFRALDVEQIGHVYEGLLDHSARMADGVALGLIGKQGYEPEVSLEELEALSAAGNAKLLTELSEMTSRTQKALEKLMAVAPDAEKTRLLRTACENDEALVTRLVPYIQILRDDLRGLPMVIPDGGVYVTETSHRRDTGTEYTTRDLADEIVRYTLEPLVYSPGPQDGAEPSEWKLKSPAEILELTVCDPAVGSGAILVAACRYLADRLVEARFGAGEIDEDYSVDPSLAHDEDETVIRARRDIADRCLYGVDRDPMAVEMAKLSLWLTTMSKDRPFTFIDHAIQAGDSLLGLTEVEQLLAFHMTPSRGQALASSLFDDVSAAIKPTIELALQTRRELEARSVMDARDVAWKSVMYSRANDALREAKVLADLLVGAALSSGGNETQLEQRLNQVRGEVASALVSDPEVRAEYFQRLESVADSWLNEGRPYGAAQRRPLHWPVAFPEVFSQGGFTAIVGNPPFLGGSRISGSNGADYRAYLDAWVTCAASGRADLVAHFFRRAAEIGRAFGLLATNSIAQGDSREAGLEPLLRAGWTLHRAVKSRPWPGSATLEVSQVWGCLSEWRGARQLDGAFVASIDSQLRVPGAVVGEPYGLTANGGKTFEGMKLTGIGFTLPVSDALAWIASDAKYGEVLRPFLSGDDLNGRPDAQATRWAIDFNDWPEERAAGYPLAFAKVEADVKGVRQRLRSDGSFQLRSPLPQRWWQYGEKRPALRAATMGLERCIALTRVSNTVMPLFVPTGQVFSDSLTIFASDDAALLAVLSSQAHWHWAVKYGSSLRTDVRYTPSDVFETFPIPKLTEALRVLGEQLSNARARIMGDSGLGLTKTYGKVHNPSCTDGDVLLLRELHRTLDVAVMAAYGWEDVNLNYGHHETSLGPKWTFDLPAQRQLLDRLLELNHARHAAEPTVASGKRRGGLRNAGVDAPNQPGTASDQLMMEIS